MAFEGRGERERKKVAPIFPTKPSPSNRLMFMGTCAKQLKSSCILISLCPFNSLFRASSHPGYQPRQVVRSFLGIKDWIQCGIPSHSPHPNHSSSSLLQPSSSLVMSLPANAVSDASR